MSLSISWTSLWWSSRPRSCVEGASEWNDQKHREVNEYFLMVTCPLSQEPYLQLLWVLCVIGVHE